MATALQTIGKFTIKKKVGEKDSIFGRSGNSRNVLHTTAASLHATVQLVYGKHNQLAQL